MERYYPEIADNNWHDQCGEALETFRSASGSKSSSSTTSGTTRGHRARRMCQGTTRRAKAASRPERHQWPSRSASIARAAVSPITSERIVPPGTSLSTPTSTRRGSGWAVPPTRQSSYGWPPTIAQARTRSTFASMEHQWCLSRERSRIDHLGPKDGDNVSIIDRDPTY